MRYRIRRWIERWEEHPFLFGLSIGMALLLVRFLWMVFL